MGEHLAQAAMHVKAPQATKAPGSAQPRIFKGYSFRARLREAIQGPEARSCRSRYALTRTKCPIYRRAGDPQHCDGKVAQVDAAKAWAPFDRKTYGQHCSSSSNIPNLPFPQDPSTATQPDLLIRGIIYIYITYLGSRQASGGTPRRGRARSTLRARERNAIVSCPGPRATY